MKKCKGRLKRKQACVTEEIEQDRCEKRSLIESNNNNRELNENGEWR